MIDEFLDAEYDMFPVAAHDDMLDCMARLYDKDVYLRWPYPSSEKDPYAKDDAIDNTTFMSF